MNVVRKDEWLNKTDNISIYAPDTPETKFKKSVASKKRIADGTQKTNTWQGRTHTEETKNKMSLIQKGKSKPPATKNKMSAVAHSRSSAEKHRYSSYMNRLIKCVHCGVENTTGNNARWHGDKCKRSPIIDAI